MPTRTCVWSGRGIPPGGTRHVSHTKSSYTVIFIFIFSLSLLSLSIYLLSIYLSIYLLLLSSIYIKEKSCPSVCLSVTLLILLGLSISPYQLPNVKNPSSSSFKFVTASKCGDQLAFYRRLKTRKWRKLEQHSIENHSHMAQSVVQLTCIQEVAGSNPGGKQLFFWISILLQTRFLEFSFDITVTSHSKHASRRDLSEIERT